LRKAGSKNCDNRCTCIYSTQMQSKTTRSRHLGNRALVKMLYAPQLDRIVQPMTFYHRKIKPGKGEDLIYRKSCDIKTLSPPMILLFNRIETSLHHSAVRSSYAGRQIFLCNFRFYTYIFLLIIIDFNCS
jgi:hypothetical protein